MQNPPGAQPTPDRSAWIVSVEKEGWQLMSLPDLTWTAWTCLALGAVAIGFSKSAIAGAGAIAVVAFAFVLPARESTGAVLPLLLVGDVMAICLYRRHADVRTLMRLLPGVVPGLVLGWWFVGVVDDDVMRRTIGIILLAMVAYSLLRRRRDVGADPGRLRSRGFSLGAGGAAGFTSMTANAAGPVTTSYLIGARLPALEILGTAAWFYLIVNLAKVPFSIDLGLITAGSLLMDLALVPALLLGGWLGVALIRRIDQRRFEIAALALAGGSSLLLLL